ncbi:hypothetical protein K435DRAFT_967041 [Dendrothele bispora CBS 962.96]|uniref:Zn(2)-C6 fungal-type domain-containing protein n=1 Tax=Dendrothele bispora (strain CBS 962.96) TaxID=1314807 RepID=A0A4S8LWL6_DENBC|nr:hypothetical protein K435DRAFT_967041 [Dendrothele bispora CBS 962.96]
MLQGSGVDGSREPGHSQAQEASSSLTSSADARSKRRVSESLRRRTEVSCDRCKIRKFRRVRSSGEKRPCAACAQAAEICESTLPRKQRVYASINQLSIRYRALDHLLRQLLPDRNFETLGDLKNLASEHVIQLPSFDDSTSAPDILKHPQSATPSGTPSSSSRSVSTPTSTMPGISKNS